MSRRWSRSTIEPQDLPLVVLWKEMLAATGIPAARASQLVHERTFPISQLPSFGYSARGRGRLGRWHVDVANLTFSKAQVIRFTALDQAERERLTLLDCERPHCCHCPLHCPPAGRAAEPHPYAQRFKKRWWAE